MPPLSTTRGFGHIQQQPLLLLRDGFVLLLEPVEKRVPRLLPTTSMSSSHIPRDSMPMFRLMIISEGREVW